MDIARAADVEPVNAGQGVEEVAMPLQQLGSGEHLVKRGLLAFGDPVVIVNVARAVNTQAHQKPVLLEKTAPLLVEQSAVALEIVFDPLARLGIFFTKSSRASSGV